MTTNALEKARAAAEKASQDLAALEAAEAEKAAQKAAERDAQQRELDAAFLAKWETLDAELQAEGSKSAADAVYEGADPISAVVVFWVARAKRNAVRAHARNAYYRLNSEHPTGTFAFELSHRDMMIGDRLEDAISRAASHHAADLSDALEAQWMVPDGA
ncbi:MULTISPECIES: hypothetical protein [Streptomyces]|uniref:hypothetical protein n=1 Tax=Streptomyces TaxID=1883 RepID=UPI000B222482|nr:hypothetical protein [Streptomyces virginiae]